MPGKSIRLLACFVLAVGLGVSASAAELAGLTGPVGANENARRVKTLRIDRAGVYENILVDGDWIEEDLVRITADNVVLRNCTIRYGRRDAVEIYGRNVRLENCHIHHVIAGTYRADKNIDAHGITGRPLNLTIRNTEISHVTGDAIQFDPSRKTTPYPWDNVLVDHCFLWTGPLDRDYATYRRGEIPGENAFDSKTPPGETPRARVTLRNCLLKGWGHGAISNGAALNLKETVQAVVDRCVFVENDIAFRCRGASPKRASAWVSAIDCTVYQTSRVFRLEDHVEHVTIFDLAIGDGVKAEFDRQPGPGAGFVAEGKRVAPPLPPWPYVALPVGELAPGSGEARAHRVTPQIALATGWEGRPDVHP